MSANIAGNITSLGIPTASSSYGFVYSTSASTAATLQLGSSGVSQAEVGTTGAATGSYNTTLNSLTPSTLYYYRAYATNSTGTGYGNPQSFTTTAPPPTITVTPTTALNFGTTTTGTPSAEQSYTVGASNLTANLTVTAPAGYEISLTSNTYTGTGANVLTLTPSSGTVASTTIYVRLTAAASGTFGTSTTPVNITHASTGATTVNKPVYGAVTNPTITIGTVSPTSYCTVGTSATITVPFTTSAAFPAGNTFTVQLSTSGGSFTGATTLATVSLTSTSTNAYSITATIPANTANGTGYLVRIQASSPAVNSGSRTITIIGTQSVSISPTAAQTISKNGGTGTQLTVSETPSADVASRQWAYSTTSGGPYMAISGQNAATYTPKASDFGGAVGTYYVVEQSTFTTCGTTVTSSNAVTVTVVDTRLVVSPNSLSGFLTQAGTASAPQTYSLTGYDLLGNVTATIPTGFEAAYSTTSTAPTTYSAGTGSITILRADATAGVTVYVRLRNTTAGNYSGDIVNSSSGAVAQNVTLTGTVTGLTVSTASPATYNTLAGSPSTTGSFTLTGTSLTDPVTVAAPAGFEVATASGGPFAASLTVTPSNGTATTIYVRLAGTTAGTYGGSTDPIVVSSPNATTRNVTVSGTVVGKPTGTPTITAGTPTFNSVTLSLGAADGSRLLVVVRPAGNPATAPTDKTTYTASTTYGVGTLLGTGYVVFAAANASSVTVTGLSESTAYAADIYTYNVGTVNSFESYGLNSGTATFTTPAQPPSPAGLLLLEDDFDYAVGTKISDNGWATHSSASSNDQPAVQSGNLTRASYPVGVAGSASNQALSNSSGADVNRGFTAIAAGQTVYYSVLLNVPIGTGAAGDYFLHLVNRTNAAGTSATDFRGRLSEVYNSSTGKFKLNVNLTSGGATTTAEYAEGTTYLVIVKYTYSVSGQDAVALFVYDNATTPLPTAEPTTPAAGPVTGTSPFASQINGLAIRQSSTTPVFAIDGVRVATGWGAVIGQPVYTAAAAAINTGSYYNVTVNNSDQVAQNGAVTVENAVTLTSGSLNLNGQQLTLAGTATGSGSLTGSASSNLVVLGTGALGTLSFTTGAQTLNNLTLNRTSTGTATLGSPLTVNGILALTNGTLVTTSAAPLTLASGATYTGSSDNSFVSGPLRRALPAVSTATDYTFPIGKGANFRPLTLNIETQPATTYTVEQMEQSGGNSLNQNDPSNTNLTRVSQVRYFSVTPDVQPSGFVGRVTLSFGPNDQVNDPTAATLVVGKRDNGNPWNNNLRTGYNPGPNGTGTITSGTVLSFSDFILASTDPSAAVNPLPVELMAFTASRAAKGVALAWTTASEKNSASFEVERSLDGKAFEKVASVQAAGSSAQARRYAALDASAPASVLYYRLRQVDQDGKHAYSPIVTVAAGPAGELTLWPNPTREQLSLLTAEATPYVVRNTLGQAVLTGTTAATEATSFSVAGLPAGVYVLELRGSAGRVVRRFVKE